MRRILIAPGIAGLTVYKRELVLDKDGQRIMRVDGGLIEVPTWETLCEILKPKPDRRRPTKALLSRVLRCGICGARMVRVRRNDH